MEEKTYKVTISQSIEIQAISEQDAKEAIAEDIVDFIDWGDVTVVEIKE